MNRLLCASRASRAFAAIPLVAVSLCLPPAGAAPEVIITEINYNISGDDRPQEFIELKNVGDEPAVMDGWRFTAGVTFTFPASTTLQPGAFFVLVADSGQFNQAANYPGVPVFGQYGNDDGAVDTSGALQNSDERITLVDASDVEIFSFKYWDGRGAPDSDPSEDDLERERWPESPDGDGYTLVTLNPDANPDLGDYRNWRRSINMKGSPGADEPLPAPLEMVYISEIKSREPGNPAAATDEVELYNPGPDPVNVGDWFVTDNLDNPVKSPIPNGTVVPAGGYTRLTNGVNGFVLSVSSKGERAFLFSGDGVSPTGWVHGTHVEASADGKNFARFVDSSGKEQWITDDPSLGSDNGDPAVPDVVITEIMYSPGYGGTAEYIKIKNVGGATAPLYDTGAVPYVAADDNLSIGGFGVTIPGSLPTLGAGEEAFVTNVAEATFRAAYNVDPSATVFADTTGGGLSGGGEVIELRFPITIDGLKRDPPEDAMNPGATRPRYYAVGDEVCYDDDAPWPTTPDGLGFSLMKVNEAATGYDSPNWSASQHRGGSAYGGGIVLVNEVLAHTDAPQTDVIELYNPGPDPVDIGGWYLTDDPLTAPLKFRIPNGVTVPAGGFWAFNEDNDFNPNTTPPATGYFGGSFSISSRGDEIFLFSGNGAGNATGYSHGADFRATANGVSIIRHVNSEGRETFPPQAGAPTVQILPSTPFPTGMANSEPRVERAVISEILYEPGIGDTEFIEITNISSSTLALYDNNPGGNTANNWQLDGVTFTFPGALPTIPAGGKVVIIPQGVSAADFRTQYGVPAGITIYGDANGYIGALNNGGEEIELLRPDKPDVVPGQGVIVPLIPVDVVTYDEAAPWPVAGGKSIERINNYLFGDEPQNWQVSSPGTATPGAENSGYAGWMMDQFTPAELRGPGIGPGDDFSGTGYINAVAYTFGYSPKGPPDFSKFPQVTTVGSGASETLGISFRQRIGATDFGVQVQHSSDCSVWLDIDRTAGVAIDNGDGTETVTHVDGAPIGAGPSFLRAVVEQLSP